MKALAILLLLGFGAGCDTGDQSGHQPSSGQTGYSEHPGISPGEINIANGLALAYAHAVLSDDILTLQKLKHAPSNLAEAKRAGLPRWIQGLIPPDFTISGIPYPRYKKKYRYDNPRGSRILLIEFFDPRAFPNWKEIPGIQGGFPGHFVLFIDMERRQVTEHAAYS